MKRLPLALGYETRKFRYGAESYRVCNNLVAERLPDGSKTPFSLRRIEGIATIVASGGALGSSALRGMKTFDGKLFVCAINGLFEVSVLGTVTQRGGNVITGFGRVYMTCNSFQLTISNLSGSAWVWNGATLLPIVDLDFPSVGWVETLDEYLVYGRLDGQGWGISALSDAMTYDPLDVASAESQPDRIVTGIRNGRELVLFGEQTTEPFYNSGNADFPFDRATDGVIDVGCAAKRSVTRAGNTVYWLATEKGGLSVRRLSGREPERVSTGDIDDELDVLNLDPFDGGDDSLKPFAFGYSYAGHAYYVLTVPTLYKTYVYDITTNLWQTRSSSQMPAKPFSDPLQRPWRVGMSETAYGIAFLGDQTQGGLGKVTTDTVSEYGFNIPWETITPPVQFENRKLTHAVVELELDTKPKNVSPPREVTLRFSDNDGETWSPPFSRTQTLSIDSRNRLRWTNLGSSVSRIYSFSSQQQPPIGIIRAFVDLDVGA